ncbi:MAG TPA: carboxypeptidase-like regulatory domain-containing protein, partial [Puia sp.]|nr:carboxypeptidase-like regulatory domain-containing protein [Puia sp.]
MRKKLSPIPVLAILLLMLVSSPSFSQNSITVSGNVRQAVSGDRVPAVSVTIKGTSIGTYTDEHGNFRLTTNQQPPFVLVFSSIGFETREVQVAGASNAITVDLAAASTLGREVVVSATRGAIRSLESPVSIERMGATTAHEV